MAEGRHSGFYRVERSLMLIFHLRLEFNLSLPHEFDRMLAFRVPLRHLAGDGKQ